MTHSARTPIPALYLNSQGNVQIVHTTIAGPAVTNGSAIQVVTATVGITDAIIASHTVGISVTGGAVYEDYNLFFANTQPGQGTISSGTHDVNGNPAFVDPAGGNYHLTSLSAAIDAGVNGGVLTDLDSNVRPQGGQVDIGAYESLYAIDLAIAKTGTPSQVHPGQAVTYTLTYTQAGSGGIARHVVITDRLPISLTNLAYASGGATITPTGSISYVWQVADLSAGMSGVITLTGIVSPGLAGLPIGLTNTVSIAGSTGDANPSNNTSGVSLALADTAITVLAGSNDGPTPLGSVTTLTATATGSVVAFIWNSDCCKNETLPIRTLVTYPSGGDAARLYPRHSPSAGLCPFGPTDLPFSACFERSLSHYGQIRRTTTLRKRLYGSNQTIFDGFRRSQMDKVELRQQTENTTRGRSLRRRVVCPSSGS